MANPPEAGPTILRERGNNFDFIRWLAASCVVFSHEFALVPGAGSEPLLAWTSGFLTLGSLAVDVFFVVSGFLVTRSLLERHSLAFFAAARALRVLPALAVVSVLSALVLGPIASSLSVGDYLRQHSTWTYIARNAVPIRPQFKLPGVFEGQGADGVVNAPLWSLPPELAMYATLFALGVASLAWPGRRRAVVAAGMTAVMVAGFVHHGDLRGHGLEPTSIYRLAPYFAAGSLLHLLDPWVPRTPWAFVAAALATIAGAGTPAFVPAFTVATALAVVGFARWPIRGLSGWGRRGDFSYGLYIFAFPIQQAIVAAFPQLSLGAHFALAYPLALACAVASWRLVEAPALAQKRRFLPRGAVATDPQGTARHGGGRTAGRRP